MNKKDWGILFLFILYLVSLALVTVYFLKAGNHKVLLDYLPLWATVLLTICYVPQIVKIAKTKNVEGISVWFWLILNMALSTMFTNAYVIFHLFSTYGYLVTETINEGLALVVFLQVLKYRKKNP